MEQGMLFSLWFAAMVTLAVSFVILMVYTFSPVELGELYDDELSDE